MGTCLTQENRLPSGADWLYQEPNQVKPKVVVAMGATASYALLRAKAVRLAA